MDANRQTADTEAHFNSLQSCHSCLRAAVIHKTFFPLSVHSHEHERQQARRDLSSVTACNLVDKTCEISLGSSKDKDPLGHSWRHAHAHTHRPRLLFINLCHMLVTHSNLQHLLQKVDVSAGALRAVLQGPHPQFLPHFLVVRCLLKGWESTFKNRNKTLFPAECEHFTGVLIS